MITFKNNTNKYIWPQNRLSVNISPNEAVKFKGTKGQNILIQSLCDMTEYKHGVPILEITRKDWQNFVPIG